MADLQRELGLSYLFIAHDLAVVQHISHRVAVMYLGRIVEVGTTEEMLSEPRHPYTRALLSVVPESQRLEQRILQGEAPDPRRVPPGCRFHPRCPLVQSGEAERLGILERCRSEDVALAPVAGTPEHVAACHAL